VALTPNRAATAPAIPALAGSEHERRTELSRSWRRFKRYRPGLVGLAFILLLVVVAIFAPLLAPYDPNVGETSLRGASPSRDFLLGNDHIGRDMLSRLIYGTRIALIVGIGATTIAAAIGVVIGAAAGYFRGWADSLLSRIVDALMAFPTLALLITLAAVIGPSLLTVVITIGTTVWASYARVVRADVLSLRERDFILAARAAGAGHARIIFRHILPNALGPVIVLATLAVGSIIILESALSFLGLGVKPPTASWGGMLSDGRAYIRTYPHISIAPGLAITLTVLAFNLLGDGLRDALDPRQRE
jgi:ABC-type dipeptide/oligopeptide/nickel transport system permease subunit